MKKRYAAIVLMICLSAGLILGGCGSRNAGTDSGQQTGESGEQNTEQEASGESAAEQQPEVLQAETDAASAEPASYDFEVIRDEESFTEYGTVRALDTNGGELWSYQTPEVEMTELTGIQTIGPAKEGYLLLAGGSILCIETSGADAGTLKWQNDEFGGAGACWDMDEEGNLYIAGYYGPALMIIDPKGNTIRRYTSIGDDYYWPYEVEVSEGNARIRFESMEGTVLLDLETGDFYQQVAQIRAKEQFVVSDVNELMEVIGSDREILLAPGTYDLTAWISENSPALYEDELDAECQVYREEVYDGEQLVLYGISNLTIGSQDPEHQAQIVAEPRYADVLTFCSGEDILLENLILGHTSAQGYCEGDVVAIESCGNVSLNNCELYGCGAYALEILTSSDVNVEFCDIHNCTYGCLTSNYSDSLCFSYTTFEDCREFTMFEMVGSDAAFYGCTFRRLSGNMVSLNNYSSAYFQGCTFDAAALDSLRDNPEYGGNLTIQ